MAPELLSQLISSLLALLGVEFSRVEVTSGHRTIVHVTSPDTNELIGAQGEHLQALNTVARRLVETKYGVEASSFLIDVNNFHEDKLEVVRANARTLAQRVRLFKHDVEMTPASSYERLVIHELFAEDPQIQTTSEGEGKFRHVVLKYTDKKKSTA